MTKRNGKTAKMPKLTAKKQPRQMLKTAITSWFGGDIAVKKFIS
jgi:hypothetical protein